MTEVLFYTHVENKLQAACQLAAKAFGKRMRVMLLTPGAELTERVSRMLWSTPSIGFYPHCRAGDRLATVTPIIVDHLAEPLLHDQVLINLCDEAPSFFSRFQRLVEIVSTEDADRKSARTRYRFYRDRGYEIRTHRIGDPQG